RIFKDKYRVGTLSRGYGRKTKGFLAATDTSTAAQIGDEPAQFKHKFPGISVAVCEDRVEGIKELRATCNLIILDDAYQHRKVKPGFSILLFDYAKIDKTHLLIPAGNMREPFSGRWRAEVLIVTKCPPNLPADQQTRIADKLQPLPFQSLFFTAISYQSLQDMEGKKAGVVLDADTTVFLLTGIANPLPLERHLGEYTQNIVHHNYADHHRFSLKNITKLADEFAACDAQKKVIITTEKDAARLLEHELHRAVKELPILVMPVATAFLDNSGPQFDNLVKEYVREHSANHVIH
ncbi:MAG TPA: tetraacyldisaccharide 4'-kinase, partial [Mucilaginibacter sp.]|nr:tetraacyldisaccharide 4'-kinase [Mucilaginibacter sp.]